MTRLLDRLAGVWTGATAPFLVQGTSELRFRDLTESIPDCLSLIRPGDVVAIVGDFEPESIRTLLHLIDSRVIVVPLTRQTAADHDYFFEAAGVDVIIEGGSARRRAHGQRHELIDELRRRAHPGLVLFSSGTTARPKAILHDFDHFLRRYETPRPALRTVNFLLFDHIGGINTLLHTLFNRGTVVGLRERSVTGVLDACRQHAVEVLPATPTFLRMMLMSGAAERDFPKSLKIITYGTERMDQPSLDSLCEVLPEVDFRQTYGMSELGIVRVKSEARNSLFMRIGGEGVESRVVGDVLHIRSESRMLGYLNAPSPFDEEGWYDTKDVVETRQGFCRIVGRVNEIINVGGLKFMPSEVEQIALRFPDVALASAVGRRNPITGQHVELSVEPREGAVLNRDDLSRFLKSALQPHMVPKRIVVDKIAVGHRFKRAGLSP